MPDLPTGLHVVAAGFLLRAVLRRPLRARAAGGASACSVILAGAAGLAPVPGGASRQDERQGGVHEQLSLPPPSFPPGPGERRGDRVRERAGGLGFDGATELKEATLFVLFCRAGLNLILELIKPWTWLERGGVGPWVGGPQQRGDIASGVLRPSQPSREATHASSRPLQPTERPPRGHPEPFLHESGCSTRGAIMDLDEAAREELRHIRQQAREEMRQQGMDPDAPFHPVLRRRCPEAMLTCTHASASTPEPLPWSSTPEPQPSSRPTKHPPMRPPPRPTPVPKLCPTVSAALEARRRKLLAMGQMGQVAMEDLILKCSAGIPLQILQHKGIGDMLRGRLSIALRVDLFRKDEETNRLVSKFGKAKWHLFTPGVKFNRRRRAARRPRLEDAAAVERIESSVKDFLDSQDLAWNVDSAVEAWLCNGETESLCSDAAADVWRWADLPEERAPADAVLRRQCIDAVLRRQCIDASEEREAQQKAASSGSLSEPEEEC